MSTRKEKEIKYLMYLKEKLIKETKKPIYYLLVTKGKQSADYINYLALKSNQDFNDEWFSQNFEEVLI